MNYKTCENECIFFFNIYFWLCRVLTVARSCLCGTGLSLVGVVGSLVVARGLS